MPEFDTGCVMSGASHTATQCWGRVMYHRQGAAVESAVAAGPLAEPALPPPQQCLRLLQSQSLPPHLPGTVGEAPARIHTGASVLWCFA